LRAQPVVTVPTNPGLARIAEAEREVWPGEVEGLKVSLAGAEHKNSPS